MVHRYSVKRWQNRNTQFGGAITHRLYKDDKDYKDYKQYGSDFYYYYLYAIKFDGDDKLYLPFCKTGWWGSGGSSYPHSTESKYRNLQNTILEIERDFKSAIDLFNYNEISYMSINLATGKMDFVLDQYAGKYESDDIPDEEERNHVLKKRDKTDFIPSYIDATYYEGDDYARGIDVGIDFFKKHIQPQSKRYIIEFPTIINRINGDFVVVKTDQCEIKCENLVFKCPTLETMTKLKL